MKWTDYEELTFSCLLIRKWQIFNSTVINNSSNRERIALSREVTKEAGLVTYGSKINSTNDVYGL